MEIYSYVDAKLRKPEAWEIIDINGDGWSRRESKDVSKPGLGELVYQSGQWIYVLQNGLAVPTWEYDEAKRPQLPKHPSKRKKCGCRLGGSHNCSACGQPYWIEMHGCADGFCTYCYYHG